MNRVTGWPWAIALWVAVFLWAYWPEFRVVRTALRSPAARSPADAGSLRLIMIGMWVGIGVAIAATRFRQFAMPHPRVVYVAGIALLVSGSLLRRHCFRVLGEWFTGAVQVRERQPVVEMGAYRWVRHPSYAAGMLMSIAIGTTFFNWLSLAALILFPLAAYAYRIHVEERALVGTIGAPYAEYMGRTKRLVPFVV